MTGLRKTVDWFLNETRNKSLDEKRSDSTIKLYTLKGYFDLIASVDEFIIYDEVQFTRRDWRNRNRRKLLTEQVG